MFVKTRSHAVLLAVAAALVCPAGAQAANLTMTFTGTVLPGSTGKIMLEDTSSLGVSFDGQPANISITLSGAPSDPYVSSFSASWSSQPQSLPFVTEIGGTGVPCDLVGPTQNDFCSQVSLTPTGGSIHIRASDFFVSYYDAEVMLDVNYTLSSPHDPFLPFTDNGVTGGGSADAYYTFLYRPDVGLYDTDSEPHFSLSGVSSTGVPEPAAWAMMLVGFGGLGAALRRRRASAVPV